MEDSLGLKRAGQLGRCLRERGIRSAISKVYGINIASELVDLISDSYQEFLGTSVGLVVE